MKAHIRLNPWSKYLCASGDRVVIGRCTLPRSANNMAPCAHSEIVVGRRSIGCASGPTEAVAGVGEAAVVGGVTDLQQPATISRQLAKRTSEFEFMTTPIAPNEEFSLPKSHRRPQNKREKPVRRPSFGLTGCGQGTRTNLDLPKPAVRQRRRWVNKRPLPTPLEFSN